jgi:hypothetical protein
MIDSQQCRDYARDCIRMQAPRGRLWSAERKFYEAYFLGKPLGNVPKLIYQQVSYAIRPLGLLARRRDVFQRVKPSIANGPDHKPEFANLGLHLSCYWRLQFNYGGHISP